MRRVRQSHLWGLCNIWALGNKFRCSYFDPKKNASLVRYINVITVTYRAVYCTGAWAFKEIQFSILETSISRIFNPYHVETALVSVAYDGFIGLLFLY